MNRREILKQIILNLRDKQKELLRRWGHDDMPEIPKNQYVILGECIRWTQEEIVRLNQEEEGV